MLTKSITHGISINQNIKITYLHVSRKKVDRKKTNQTMLNILSLTKTNPYIINLYFYRWNRSKIYFEFFFLRVDYYSSPHIFTHVYYIIEHLFTQNLRYKYFYYFMLLLFFCVSIKFWFPPWKFLYDSLLLKSIIVLLSLILCKYIFWLNFNKNQHIIISCLMYYTIPSKGSFFFILEIFLLIVSTVSWIFEWNERCALNCFWYKIQTLPNFILY